LRFADHLGPTDKLSERKLAEIYEQHRPGVVTRHLLNPDHLMWGSDHPHSEGTFPHSKERIEQDFADIPEAETRRLVHDNAAEFYGLS
jgi:predicted TIM-barrel fold metal-dependent hydrolase